MHGHERTAAFCDLSRSLWRWLAGWVTAWRARQVNQRISKTAHIKELNTEIGRLKAELHATREKNGVYIPLEHFHQQEQARRASHVPTCRLSGRYHTSVLLPLMYVAITVELQAR